MVHTGTKDLSSKADLFLKSVPLLSPLTDAQRAMLAENLEEIFFDDGEYVVNMGDIDWYPCRKSWCDKKFTAHVARAKHEQQCYEPDDDLPNPMPAQAAASSAAASGSDAAACRQSAASSSASSSAAHEAQGSSTRATGSSSAVPAQPAGSDASRWATAGGASAKIVRLNVGGQLFCTTLETLQKQESMLSLMFSGRFNPALTDERGAVLIDRDGVPAWPNWPSCGRGGARASPDTTYFRPKAVDLGCHNLASLIYTIPSCVSFLAEDAVT